MPGMSGPDLVLQIRPKRPDMKILYASGYTERLLSQDERSGELNFIPKPFVSKTLLAKVREVLDQPEEPIRPPELRLVGGA
jgi:two-component system, cell cycle sensor histidine kinase and response regulator CckA